MKLKEWHQAVGGTNSTLKNFIPRASEISFLTLPHGHKMANLAPDTTSTVKGARKDKETVQVVSII